MIMLEKGYRVAINPLSRMLIFPHLDGIMRADYRAASMTIIPCLPKARLLTIQEPGPHRKLAGSRLSADAMSAMAVAIAGVLSMILRACGLKSSRCWRSAVNAAADGRIR
jgi:hypothetical protein